MPRVLTLKLWGCIWVAFTLDDFGHADDVAWSATELRAKRTCLEKHSARIDPPTWLDRERERQG